MSGSRKGSKRSPQRIAGEIARELRHILNVLCELLRPINRFDESPQRPVGVPRYFVSFDTKPHQDVTGLKRKIRQLSFPVEAISEQAALLAASVWHLKDRLHHYAKATKSPADSTAWANSSRDLLICGDIGNLKKHGHSPNWSGVNPRIVPEIIFDTSRNGLLELHYNGATKHAELLVTEPVPIPYRVDIADATGAVIGDAGTIIQAGFNHWLPLIRELGVLDGDGAEETALRNVLFK